MTPQELKNSILQLAIQGKLVEQRPEEGTTEELFARIQEEKQRLIAEKKIKKEKPLPEITDDEKPFDIPESWKWVRLGEVFNITMGQSPKGTSVSENGLGLEFHQGKVYFGVDYLEKTSQTTEEITKIAEPNSILLCVRAPVGIVNIVDRKICIGRGLCAITSFGVMSEKFMLFFIRAFQNDFIKKSTGTTFKAITNEVVKNQLFPLPPLAEQKRIVAKIEELLPYIDRYEQAWSKLEQFNSRFPEDMKKSLLQYAIQGKLVEQRPEEGTAEELFAQIQGEKQRLIAEKKIKKEKPLPEITEDEKPFDIPESWKWVRLGTLVQFENGDRSSKYPVETDYVDSGIPFFGAKDMGEKYMLFDNVRYISESKFNELGNGKLQDLDFICLLRGSVGKIAIFAKDLKHQTGFICAQMVILRCIDSSMVQYLYHIMKSAYYVKIVESKTTGTAVRQLPAKELANVIIPLPPLAEQKRIVEKLEQLLPLCERLK